MATRPRHRKQVRHFHQPGDFHELTFSCYRRLPLLTNDDWRRRLAKSIDEAGVKARVELVGFVFMPEHVHLSGKWHTSEHIDRATQPPKQRRSAIDVAAAEPLPKTATGKSASVWARRTLTRFGRF